MSTADRLIDRTRAGLYVVAHVAADGMLHTAYYGYESVTYKLDVGYSDHLVHSTITSEDYAEQLECLFPEASSLTPTIGVWERDLAIEGRPGWYYCEDMPRFPALVEDDPLVYGSIRVYNDRMRVDDSWHDMPYPVHLCRMIMLADVSYANLCVAWRPYP